MRGRLALALMVEPRKHNAEWQFRLSGLSRGVQGMSRGFSRLIQLLIIRRDRPSRKR